MDLTRFEISNEPRKQLDVPLDHIDAALATRLSHVPSGAVGEGRNSVFLALVLVADPRHLDTKSFLSLFLCDGADTQANADAETPLIDESAAVSKDRMPGVRVLAMGFSRHKSTSIFTALASVKRLCLHRRMRLMGVNAADALIVIEMSFGVVATLTPQDMPGALSVDSPVECALTGSPPSRVR